MRALPNLRQLRYLVALADHLHFGRAAQACSVTQSTLSAGIHELEALLKTPVAERTKRSVILTPVGHRVAERARLLLRDAESLVDVAASATDPLAGQIDVGVIPTISPFVLPRLVPHVSQHFPQLRLTLREDKTSVLLEWLAAGRLDLLLMAFPYETPGCDTLMLFEDAYRFACAASHPLAWAEEVSVDVLDGESVLLLEKDQCLHSHALPLLEAVSVSAVTSFSATSLHTLVAMVGEGLGTTLLPDLAIDGGILLGSSVVVRPLAGGASRRQIGLAWRKQSTRADAFLKLGALIKDWAKQNVVSAPEMVKPDTAPKAPGGRRRTAAGARAEGPGVNGR